MSIDTFPFPDISTLPRDQLVAVPAGLLQDLIEAHQDVKDEVASLQDEMAQYRQEIAALTARVASLEGLQEQDVTRIYCDIAQDRQRIAKLEKPPEPQPLQKDRAEVLRALLAANGGKMLASEARRKMHIRSDLFSKLLKTCDFLETKPLHSDRRKEIIILK
jgi:uncharacterized membrane-anchored protein YhcB (DUF1043 family)